ncbi:MAG: DNA-processing protein DprA [Proteobacteria bacterium]|nr:MAG: DNA-processing protein DprA [Pseudomonadota bacterium]
MFCSNQLEAIITHAVSQLTYKWLPIPLTGNEERRDPLALTLSDWKNYVEEQVAAASQAAWVQAVVKSQLSLIGLSTVIFDNLQKIEKSGAYFLDFHHPTYPYLLKHISDPPAGITCMGDLGLFLRPKIGVVGSRKASDFAFKEARALAYQIAISGGTIVSGGAIGCDQAAHLGALDSELFPAPTILVFAGGLESLYPRCLQSMFERLKARDALFISERLWELPAMPRDFPVRNRIIAGLSSYLALMQAGEKSGALKTASYALEQGREVYALVHEEDDKRAVGSRRLIDEGACPFHSVSDFFSTKLMF